MRLLRWLEAQLDRPDGRFVRLLMVGVLLGAVYFAGRSAF